MNAGRVFFCEVEAGNQEPMKEEGKVGRNGEVAGY
jgi:hypothetical protein